MTEPRRERDVAEAPADLAQVAMQLARWPFGPPFFAQQLGALVRERCPDPSEGLPGVRLYLHNGECLDLCHVIGFAPQWVARAPY